MIRSIKSKIFLILIIFLLLTIGSSLVSISNFNKLQRSIDLIMQDNYESVVAAQQMKESIERQDSLELAFLFENRNTLSTVHEENHLKFQEWLYKAKANITEDGEIKVLNNIEENYANYTSKVRELEKIKKEKGNDKAEKFYYDEILPVFRVLKGDTSNLLEINQESMLNKKEESKKLANSASYYTVSILGIALISGLSIMGYLLRKIIKPIEDLDFGIKEVASGNYEYEIPLKRDKEINFILKEFNNMVKQLRKYERLNIDEILREKQKGEAIIESIDSPIIVTDYNNKVTMINKSAERILDIKEKNVINRHFLEGVKNKDIFNSIQKSSEAIKEYKIIEDIEILEGENKNYFRVIVNPIWFQRNENIGTVTLMQDITKFREVEKMKTEFVATVSHEFRTPLTSIIMAVELLLERNFNSKDEMDELLGIVKDDSERLNSLVEELLDLSKMESGRIEMDIRDVDIRRILKSIENTFKIQLDEKKIRFTVDDIGISRYVKADFNKISWVIVNLVGNAMRYVKKDGDGEINIKINEVNSNMLIAISDNGEGISEEDQKVIFEKFVQLKNKNGETTGSSGLGLAICKEIVKAHMGEIWVDSILEGGSTFYFTLKLGGDIFQGENL